MSSYWSSRHSVGSYCWAGILPFEREIVALGRLVDVHFVERLLLDVDNFLVFVKREIHGCSHVLVEEPSTETQLTGELPEVVTAS